MSLTSYNFSRIKVEEGSFYYIIRMNRPEVRNAVDPQMLDEINVVIDEAEKDEKKTGIVISSVSNEFFASGGDLKYFLSLDDYQKGYQMSREYGEKFLKWERSSLLIISAIEGYSIGGGAELALVTDLLVAGENASFQFKQIKLGLITGWGGATRLLRKVGMSRALYLLTSGVRINAKFGYKIGLVDFMVPVGHAEERAVEILESLKDSHRDSVAFYKKIIYDYGWKDREIALEAERKLFAELWDAPRHREAERAFFSYRKREN